MSPIRTLRVASGARRQRGVVLVISLIVLVAMALAGIAMVRQISGGLGIAGNLAFKQAATSVGDFGIEKAREWLMTKTSAELVANVGTFYYGAWGAAAENPITATWTDATSMLATPASGDSIGNVVRYKIHRLCSTSGLTVSDPANECVILSAAGSGATKQGFSDGEAPLSTTTQPYYRLTAQVIGPRNTVSYVQTIMY